MALHNFLCVSFTEHPIWHLKPLQTDSIVHSLLWKWTSSTIHGTEAPAVKKVKCYIKVGKLVEKSCKRHWIWFDYSWDENSVSHILWNSKQV